MVKLEKMAPKTESPIGAPKIATAPLRGLILIIIIAAIAISGYFYQQYRKTQGELAKLKSDPREAARQETQSLVKKAGQLVVLPEGEDPTMATITDIEKLKNQPFFANAKNGDRVLIYTQAKKAYLYDSVANKILNVAPLNIGTPSATPASPSPEPTE